MEVVDIKKSHYILRDVNGTGIWVILFQSQVPVSLWFVSQLGKTDLRPSQMSTVFAIRSDFPVNPSLRLNPASNYLELQTKFFFLKKKRIMYSCPTHKPRHLSLAIEKYKYRMLYEDLIGGVLNFRIKHYLQVNGIIDHFYFYLKLSSEAVTLFVSCKKATLTSIGHGEGKMTT
jgi:hypothetical protein